MSKVDLSLTIKQVSKLAQEFDFLRKEVISKIDCKALSNEALGAVDLLDNVKHELMALIDGRPKPFQLEDRYIKGEARFGTLERWGQSCARGYEVKAIIGNQDFSTAELLSLSEWIQKVLAFHEVEHNLESTGTNYE